MSYLFIVQFILGCLFGIFIFQLYSEVNSEYEQVKKIQRTLTSLASESRFSRQPDYGSPFDDFSRQEEPTRDPDVWPPPTPIENR